MRNSDRVNSLFTKELSSSSPQVFTTGESRPGLPVLVLLGQKTRRQWGARGDGHSSCRRSLARQRGPWGPVARSTIDNTDADNGTGVLNYLKIATVLYENMKLIFFKACNLTRNFT